MEKKSNQGLVISSIVCGLVVVGIIALLNGIDAGEIRSSGIVCDKHTVTREVGPSTVSKRVTVFRLDDGTYILSDDPIVSDLCKDAVEIKMVETYYTIFGTHPWSSKYCKIVVGEEACSFKPKNLLLRRIIMWIYDELCIMWKDTRVLTFDGTDCHITIDKPEWIPIALQDSIYWTKQCDAADTKEYAARCDIAVRCIFEWIQRRFLNFDRVNADVALCCTRVSGDLPDQYIELLYRTHVTTLYDCYWVCSTGDLINYNWDRVNPYRRDLNPELQDMFLYCKHLDYRHGCNSVEWTTQGNAPKAWFREDNGNTYMLKGHLHPHLESARMEVMCSKLLDKMPLDHVKYEAVSGLAEYTVRCDLLTSEDLHMWLGTEIDKDKLIDGANILIKLGNLRVRNAYFMYIADYLLCNPFRSLSSFGLLYKEPNDDISCMAPLMNFDQAFTEEAMANPDAPYMETPVSLRTAARTARSSVDFYFTRPIVRDDFHTLEQFQEFNKRACELMIPTLTEYELRVAKAIRDNGVNMKLNDVLDALPDAELDDESLGYAVRTLI